MEEELWPHFATGIKSRLFPWVPKAPRNWPPPASPVITPSLLLLPFILVFLKPCQDCSHLSLGSSYSHSALGSRPYLAGTSASPSSRFKLAEALPTTVQSQAAVPCAPRHPLVHLYVALSPPGVSFFVGLSSPACKLLWGRDLFCLVVSFLHS